MKNNNNGDDDRGDVEKKYGKMTTMLLLYQYPMVRSNGPIQSRCLGLAEEDWLTTEMALQPRRTIYIFATQYIYPITTLLKCAINCCMQILAFWTGFAFT